MNLRLQNFILQGNPHLEIGLHTCVANLMDCTCRTEEIESLVNRDNSLVTNVREDFSIEAPQTKHIFFNF